MFHFSFVNFKYLLLFFCCILVRNVMGVGGGGGRWRCGAGGGGKSVEGSKEDCRGLKEVGGRSEGR